MKRNYLISLIFTGLLGMTLSFGLAWHFYRVEESEYLLTFRQEVDQRVAALNRELSLRFEALFTLKSLFEGSESVEPEEFSRIATETLARHAPIQWFAWAPRKEASGNRADYPVSLMEPREAAGRLLGFDLGTIPALEKTLQAGKEAGSLRALPLAELNLQPPLNQGLLLMLPVYRSGAGELQGFIVGLLPFQQMVASYFDQPGPSKPAVVLVDCLQIPACGVENAEPPFRSALLQVGDRSFGVLAWPPAKYLNRQRPPLGLLALVTGIIITFLLVSYQRVLTRRTTDIEELVAERTRKLHEANDKLANLSMTDGLTGIANRRNFDSHLEVEWRRALREQQPLTLIMVDIDHFKAYNDRYGHLAGDNCLRLVAESLHGQASRPGDLVARYGGEEFALVLPRTDRAAQALGNQCRIGIENLRIPHDTSPTAPWVTVSVGVASMIPSRNSHFSELVDRADRALYLAKQKGRNQTALIA